jgi:SAM-dependent methyltransferase
VKATYQSHDGVKGVSDSARKLERIALPADLTGKAVLDIGCNEGFFCWQAFKRGAAKVVGIDTSADALAEASRRYGGSPRLEFLQQSWRELPEGRFDIVLWMSAMHYERDPAAMFAQIASRLASGGLFILECGVLEIPGPMMAPYPRNTDMPAYPTEEFLRHSLARHFAFDLVAPAEFTSGDPVPRRVYHCRLQLPTVAVLHGSSMAGKSTLARLLLPVATKTIIVDFWLDMLARKRDEHDHLAAWLKEHFDATNLEPVYRGIDEVGLTDAFAAVLADGIVPSDQLVVIDGAVTATQVKALAARLRGRAVVWAVGRPEGERFLTRSGRPA